MCGYQLYLIPVLSLSSSVVTHTRKLTTSTSSSQIPNYPRNVPQNTASHIYLIHRSTVTFSCSHKYEKRNNKCLYQPIKLFHTTQNVEEILTFYGAFHVKGVHGGAVG